MYHGVERMRQLLEAQDLPPGDPPDVDGPGPDPRIDAYLFDGSRRLALLATDTLDRDHLADDGTYATGTLDDEEAEEIARALRVVVEADPQAFTDDDEDAFVEAAVAQAMDDWQTGGAFGDPAPVRHQVIEDVVRDAFERLRQSR